MKSFFYETDEDGNTSVEGDGIYTCVYCVAPLDENDECSNKHCVAHPSNGGYANADCGIKKNMVSLGR